MGNNTIGIIGHNCQSTSSLAKMIEMWTNQINEEVYSFGGGIPFPIPLPYSQYIKGYQFDPYTSGHRLFITRPPMFLYEREMLGFTDSDLIDIVCKYRIYRPSKHDIPRVHFDKATKTWSSKHVSNFSKTSEPKLLLTPECEIFSDYTAEMIRVDLDAIMYRRNINLYNRCLGN